MVASRELIEEVGGRFLKEMDGIPKWERPLGGLFCQNSLFICAALMKFDISSEEDLLEMGTHNAPILSKA